MKFFDEIILKYERKLPRKTEENADVYIDWTDFNFPSFYPLIHYNPPELKQKDAQDFVSVA